MGTLLKVDDRIKNLPRHAKRLIGQSLESEYEVKLDGKKYHLVWCASSKEKQLFPQDILIVDEYETVKRILRNYDVCD